MLRKEAMFAVVGGIVGAVLTMLVGSVVPIGAQNEAEDLNVGEITCTGLRVIDGGSIAITDENEQSVVGIGSDRRGGLVAVHDKQGKAGVTIRIEEFGGLVSAQSKDGKSFATLIIDNYNGGSVLVIDKNGSSRWLTSGGVSPPMDSR